MQAEEVSKSGQESIKVLCLGAGQDVGRSCVCVTLADKTVMFDAGIHMLYSDKRRYPDFSMLYSAPNTVNNAVDLLLLTHFHLDHCGALPYLTEHHSYTGPIYTSTPTKCLLPLMLQDYRKVITQQKKEEQFYIYTAGEVRNATSRVKSIGLFETINVDGMRVTSYYAGHVLGACMFHVEYKGLSVIYTGDYNSYADRHLGAASAPRLTPNLLITETTYATTIRDTKREREQKMLQIINETVDKGGKVLIPVFALGRAQELSVLLESYWKRTDSNVPIYFSAGLIEKANLFYRLFVDWENENIKEEFSRGDNMFEFKKVKPFDKALIRADTPYVLFATPGMLHGGSSMQVFKEWCGDERNTIIIPGYCVEGTLGNKLLKGAKEVTIDKKLYEVKMRVTNISFSAHADAKGIINLARNIDPESIMFVHGDKAKMEVFHPIIKKQLGKPVFMPPNFERISIPATVQQKIVVSYPPTFARGYLISSSQPGREHYLIKEERLMEEVRKILELAADSDHVAVMNLIECEFEYEFTQEQWQLLQRYTHTLTIRSSEVKKEEEEGVKRERQKTVVEGPLEAMTQFLKEMQARHPKQEYNF